MTVRRVLPSRLGAFRERVLRPTPGRRLAFFLASDVALVALAAAAALALRHDLAPPAEALAALPLFAGLAALLTVACLGAVGAYRMNWGLVGLRDVVLVALAVSLATLLLALAVPFAAPLPPGAVLIEAPLAFLAVAGLRLSKRAARAAAAQRRRRAGVPALVVGAGDAAAQILRSLRDSTSSAYRVLGLLDDDPATHGTRIEGARVLGPVRDLERHVQARGAKAVIICIAGAKATLVRDVVRRARAAGAPEVRIIPPLHEIVGGQVTIESTREIRLEDLLHREKVHVDPGQLRGFLAGRRVLVTGGAGTIGSELCRQVARLEPERLVVLDVDETRLHDVGLELRAHAGARTAVVEALCDVRDAQALDDLFAEHRPEVVFHAAAYKHVPMMERWPLAALDVNVLGTANVADVAERHGCERFVLISTDKAVEPSSVMGASKRLAELVLFRPDEPHEHDRRMIRSAVRFGNVIGSRGSVIPIFERQLREGGPITVTHPEMQRFFMMTSEAVSLVLHAGALGEGSDVFVLDMGEPVSILGVAREFIRLHGLEPDVDVPIRITGLRPGEKLFEQLVYPEERIERTPHPGILRVRADAGAEAQRLLNAARALVASRDPDAARAFLHAQFPSLTTRWENVRVEQVGRRLRPAPTVRA